MNSKKIFGALAILLFLILWAMEIYPYAILFFKFLQFHFGSVLGIFIFLGLTVVFEFVFIVIIDRYVEIESPYFIKFLGYFFTTLIVLFIIAETNLFKIFYFQFVSASEVQKLVFFVFMGYVIFLIAITNRYEKRLVKSKKFRSLVIYYTLTLGIALFVGIYLLIFFLV
jgi:hypothetical protein